jgi:ABC-type Fe3+/spermidine/putrescine transport system ATPase subunit
MAVMREGALLQIGTPEELYHRPASRHVADFIGRSTVVAAERRDGVARLTLAGVAQEAPIASMPSGASADAFAAVVRPEALALVPPRSPAAWPGVVIARRYAGGHWVYRVSVPADGSTDENAAATFEVPSDDGRFVERDEVGIKLLGRPIALLGP